MKNQTAIEWLVDQLKTLEIFVDKESQEKAIEIFDKALAMEKEQIVDAYLQKRGKQSLTGMLKCWDKA